MKNVTPELPLAEHPETALAASPSVGQMLAALIEKGDPEKNIGVVERLIALQERQEQKQAERQFAVAFHGLQQETLGVEAVDMVPDKQGNPRYFFASYEHIMEQVGPLLLKHGFSVSFDSEFKEDRLVMRCTLTHVGGHSRVSTQYMRVGAVYGANDAQNDGATATMARRYALCSALNIVIERDTDGKGDARYEGEPISFDKAQTLREMVKEAKADEAKFLKYAGAATYEEIGSNRYQQLFRELQDRIANPVRK